MKEYRIILFDLVNDQIRKKPSKIQLHSKFQGEIIIKTADSTKLVFRLVNLFRDWLLYMLIQPGIVSWV